MFWTNGTSKLSQSSVLQKIKIFSFPPVSYTASHPYDSLSSDACKGRKIIWTFLCYSSIVPTSSLLVLLHIDQACPDQSSHTALLLHFYIFAHKIIYVARDLRVPLCQLLLRTFTSTAALFDFCKALTMPCGPQSLLNQTLRATALPISTCEPLCPEEIIRYDLSTRAWKPLHYLKRRFY